MAAVTFSGVTRTTTPATPDNLQEFRVLARCEYVVVVAETAALKVALTGTDGAAIGASYALVAAGTAQAFYLPSRQASIFVASDTASAPVSVREHSA